MNTLSMPYHFESREPSRRVTGLVVVLTLHALLGYAVIHVFHIALLDVSRLF